MLDDEQRNNYRQILKSLKNGNTDFDAIMKEIKREKDEFYETLIILEMLENGYMGFESIMEELKSWGDTSYFKHRIIEGMLKNGYRNLAAILQEKKTWTGSSHPDYLKELILMYKGFTTEMLSRYFNPLEYYAAYQNQSNIPLYKRKKSLHSYSLYLKSLGYNIPSRYFNVRECDFIAPAFKQKIKRKGN